MRGPCKACPLGAAGRALTTIEVKRVSESVQVVAREVSAFGMALDGSVMAIEGKGKAWARSARVVGTENFHPVIKITTTINHTENTPRDCFSRASALVEDRAGRDTSLCPRQRPAPPRSPTERLGSNRIGVSHDLQLEPRLPFGAVARTISNWRFCPPEVLLLSTISAWSRCSAKSTTEVPAPTAPPFSVISIWNHDLQLERLSAQSPNGSFGPQRQEIPLG